MSNVARRTRMYYILTLSYPPFLILKFRHQAITKIQFYWGTISNASTYTVKLYVYLLHPSDVVWCPHSQPLNDWRAWRLLRRNTCVTVCHNADCTHTNLVCLSSIPCSRRQVSSVPEQHWTAHCCSQENHQTSYREQRVCAELEFFTHFTEPLHMQRYLIHCTRCAYIFIGACGTAVNWEGFPSWNDTRS